MKKIALFSLLALGFLTLGAQIQHQKTTVLTGTLDVPPPDCMPNNCTN
jgi:hypothetical protein